MKKAIFATVAVFFTWAVMDYVIHGLLLGSVYASTPQLWRPMAEFKFGLNWFVVLVAAACFVYVYVFLIADRGLKTALTYGGVFGLGAGISMGYGSYSVMPIPYVLAFSWFVGTLVEALAGGVVAWFVVTRGPQA